jgi:hypothetical protein
VEIMEKWKSFLKKKVKIFYDDGGKYPSKKVGKILEINNTHIIFDNEIKERIEAILLIKIIRIEEKI